MTNELEYIVAVQDEDTISLLAATAKTFTPASAVNYTANTISITDHGFSTGDIVIYSDEGNTTIGGLTDLGPYFVSVVNSSTIVLSADGVNPVDLTDTSSSGTHSLRKLANLGSGATGQHSIVTFPTVGA